MAHIQHVMNAGRGHMRPPPTHLSPPPGVLNCPVKIDPIGLSKQRFVIPGRRGALTDLWQPDIQGDFKEARPGVGCVEFQRERETLVSLRIMVKPPQKPQMFLVSSLPVSFLSLPLVPLVSLSSSRVSRSAALRVHLFAPFL